MNHEKKIEIKTQTKKSEIRVLVWDGSLRKMSRQWALLLLERWCYAFLI